MTILITGAAQGIGAALSQHLASPANKLIILDLQKDKLAQTAAELRSSGATVIELAGDVTDPSFMAQVTQAIAADPVDVLVNNAGIVHKLKPFEELTEAELALALKVNVTAPFALIQAVLPGMLARGQGQIINVASRASIYGYEHMGIYAATKAAITSFSGTIALEHPNLKALTIIPGRTNTAMQASIRGEQEAAHAQSADFVGETIAKVITGEIPSHSGDHVLIDFGEYHVLSELTKALLHKNMH